MTTGNIEVCCNMHNVQPSKQILGIYVSPDAVAGSPEYTRELVEKTGVNSFILRTGFDPGNEPASVQKAVETVKMAGAEAYLLVGTWWGIGVNPGKQAMRSLVNWKKVEVAAAHESQWSMYTPGSSADDRVEWVLERYVKKYAPDGICLTHARFRHPADISGLFETGEGLPAEELLQNALHKVEKSLAVNGCDLLKEASKGADLAVFLNRLAGDTDFGIFSRWFACRCRLVEASLSRFRAAVKNASGGRTAFGTNAICPSMAQFCGQDYTRLTDICDFIQPLLGYVRWHVLQPIGAWARIIKTRGMSLQKNALYAENHVLGELKEAEAIGIAAGLFGLRGAGVPLSLADYNSSRMEEGEGETIESLILQQIRMCEKTADRTAGGQEARIVPVLRGQDWPEEVTERLLDRILKGESGNSRMGGALFQGIQFLAGKKSDETWSQ